mmetsp:Transcript_57129/g.93967  ORF Transcript_57129/g.93967 Transcript_57129/m.93967 type:complete len:317 (+) Transcript_57129:674-1624(+)
MKVFFLWDSAGKAEWDIVKADLKAPQGPDDFGKTYEANDDPDMPWNKNGDPFVRAEWLLLYDAKGQKMDALLGMAKTHKVCRNREFPLTPDIAFSMHMVLAWKKYNNGIWTMPERYTTDCWDDALQIFSGNKHTFAWEGSVVGDSDPVTIKVYDLNVELIDQVTFTPPAPPADTWGTEPKPIAVITSRPFSKITVLGRDGTQIFPGSKFYFRCSDKVNFAKGPAQTPVFSPRPNSEGGNVEFTSVDAEWMCHNVGPTKAVCGSSANTCSHGTATVGSVGSQRFARASVEDAHVQLSAQGCSSKGNSSVLSGLYKFL